MKRFAPVALVLLTLAGCNSQPVAQQDSAAPAQAGVLITGGRLVLPAVKGNPGAAYFTIANQSGQPATVTGIAIAGAKKAEMHITQGGAMQPLAKLDLAPSETVLFGPGGRHVMVFDLDPKVTPGTNADITVTFANGSKVSSPLTVEGPGGAMDHMDHANMKM